ncbi:ATP-dependent dna helicase pif1 [Colletotrichum musicola]|uniref:ATP-dependent DNA helicase n=1 Tax=Colletotrichum musicola TaxID=2175873 RepID=A0A8H6MMV8_9PEZI|nr:ATP-dependent dna helicase pif1 [Colletotrichum musicola]
MGRSRIGPLRRQETTEQNRDRFQFHSGPTPKYHVVYSLRGPAAYNRRRGIYTEWSGTGGAEEQTKGCANKSEHYCIVLHPSGKQFHDASLPIVGKADPDQQELLIEGVALEFRDGHLHRALQPQSSAPSEHSGPSRRFREWEDESEDEDTSRKRLRLQEQLGTHESSHASSSRPDIVPDNSDCYIIDLKGDKKQREVTNLNGDKKQREVIDLTGEEPEPEPPPEPPPLEFPLCPEQQRALDLALKGHNLFITGSGGCGKSVLVKALHRNFTARKKIVHLLAPTGQAATNIGGRTTHSYAAWKPESLGETDRELLKQARLTRTFKRLDRTNVLIIDEISMVERQLFFERLSFILSAIREDTRPFGGVQVITVGDFCQLGPVKPFKYCYEEKRYIAEDGISIPCRTRKLVNKKYTCGNAKHPTFSDRDKWAFNSPVWQDCNFRCVPLNPLAAHVAVGAYDVKQVHTVGFPGTRRQHIKHVWGSMTAMMIAMMILD